MGFDTENTLVCISVIVSLISYVLLFIMGKEEIKEEGWIEHKGLYLLVAIAMTVPIINLIILLVWSADILSKRAKKHKALKDIPVSLIKLVETFIAAKDFDYIEPTRDDSAGIKNNKLEISVTKDRIVFKYKHYSTSAFADAISKIQKQKAESVTEQLLDAYIKTRKGTA